MSAWSDQRGRQVKTVKNAPRRDRSDEIAPEEYQAFQAQQQREREAQPLVEDGPGMTSIILDELGET